MAEERLARSLTTSTQAAASSRGVLNQKLINVAERELGSAVREQVRPSIGMYAHRSSAEDAAMQRAVRAICSEALCLDLRAEEMLVGIKQAWTQLAALRARHLGDQDSDVLRGLVSSAIEMFFEARNRQVREVHC